jgi:hypothetical protein
MPAQKTPVSLSSANTQAQPSAITPLLTLQQFSEAIAYSYQGVRRLIREGRLPEGLLIRVGQVPRFNSEKTQAVINGELQILSVAEANAQGRFVSRAARADHEKRVAKQAAKAARVKAAAELNTQK